MSVKLEAYIGRKQYLLDMKGRLDDEILPVLNFCKEKLAPRSIGYWIPIRLLMPVVEAAGKVIYHDKTGGDAAIAVLRDLRVPYPEISWRLFRHNLLHNDELPPVISEEGLLIAGWEIRLDGGHRTEATRVCIDASKLYEDLFQYLQQKAGQVPDEKYPFKPTITHDALRSSPLLKQEVEELSRPRTSADHAAPEPTSSH